MIDLKKYHLHIANKKAKKLMKIFLHIALCICLIAITILWIYNYHYTNINLLRASIILFRTGILAGIFTIICGIFFSNYEQLS